MILTARGVRALGDGFVGILLPLHLTELGVTTLEIGAIATATLLGSAALTLVVGFVAMRLRFEQLLVRAALLMVATGIGFSLIVDLWPLMIVAFAGTLTHPAETSASSSRPTMRF